MTFILNSKYMERQMDYTMILRQAIEQEVFVVEEAKRTSAMHAGNSTWLFDFRAVMLQPEILNAYCEVFYERYQSKYPFQVCGLEVAAIPFVAALVMKFHEKKKPINGFFIRKSRKKSGLLKMVEGKITDDPVILVDDIVNSGLSMIRQIEVLHALDKQILEIFALLRFRDPGYYVRFQEKNIPLSTLFELNDFQGSLGVVNLSDNQYAPLAPNPFGEVRWSFQGEHPNFFYVVPKSAPVVSDGFVYFGTDDGNFFALDVVSGRVGWKYQIPFGSKGKYIFSTPAIYHDTVFFGAYDGNLYALDKRTGKRKWVFSEADWIGSSPCVAQNLHMVFIGLEYGLFRKHGGVSGIDARTGEKRWEFRSREMTHGSPAYSEKFGVVGCGSNDSIFSVLQAKTGKVLWSYKTDGPIKNAPCFADEHGVVVVLGQGETVYVFNTETGAVLSQFHMNFGSYASPLVFKDSVICTSFDKHVYCFDLFTGSLRWKFYTGSRCFTTPEIVDGLLYVGSNNARLFEIDPNTGNILGVFQTRERITNKIAYDKTTKTFLVPTFANEILALKKK